MRVFLLAALCATLLCTCTPQKKRRDRTKDHEARYKAAVARHEVRIGMTDDEVTESWGKPMRKVKEMRDGKKVVLWLYTYSEIVMDSDGYVIMFSGPG